MEMHLPELNTYLANSGIDSYDSDSIIEITHLAFADGEHKYLLIANDEDDNWMILGVTVHLGSNGLMANFDPLPIAEYTCLADCDDHIEKALGGKHV